MICPHCGEDIRGQGNADKRHMATCGKMPETAVLLRMIERGRNFDSIGREFGVSGKTVRNRVFMADPFAYEPKANYATNFDKGHCSKCGILLSCDIAQPVQGDICAGCVYDYKLAEVEVMA